MRAAKMRSTYHLRVKPGRTGFVQTAERPNENGVEIDPASNQQATARTFSRPT
jgi:hypothetical protein